MSGKVVDYNKRLFSGKGLRSFFHTARFDWARRTIRSLGQGSLHVIEVGCFDGRLLRYLPAPVERYVGLDAGWEGGLRVGQKEYADRTAYEFVLASDPSAIQAYRCEKFNLAAALETLEHVPPDMVDRYLSELAKVVEGHFLVTVPNEKGLVFLIKFLLKKAALGGAQPYRFGEVVAATLGRMDRVERNEHKGFDYAALIRQIALHFDIVRVDALPFRLLPASLSFTIGIVARSNRRVAPPS